MNINLSVFQKPTWLLAQKKNKSRAWKVLIDKFQKSWSKTIKVILTEYFRKKTVITEYTLTEYFLQKDG